MRAKNIHIAILQPLIPHYRERFFCLLREFFNVDIYLYDDSAFRQNNMCQADCSYSRLKAWGGDRLLFYNPLPFLGRQYDVLILMGAIRHISTWLLLLVAPLFGKKIILWSHGISCYRYLKYAKRLPWFYRLFFKLSSGMWLYTDAECEIWRRQTPKLPAVALGNTLSNVSEILQAQVDHKEDLKRKYQITTPFNLIFCARFTGSIRRPDLLLQAIHGLPAERFGFIIIGDGMDKPDFSSFPNVYDFGGVYDDMVKRELFGIADLYFQPGWLGLSLVEAMAYGKPVLTFARSPEIFQCVEFHYLVASGCGKMVDSIEETIRLLNTTPEEEWQALGLLGKEYVRRNLTMEHMVQQAISLIQELHMQQT